MKKFFLVLGVLLVLLIGAVVAVPFLVPTETIKSQLTAQVEEATGRKLTVDGDLDLSVLPSLAVDMGDVRFANAPGSDVADMVSLKELKVELKVLPLLSGAVEVDSFVLVEPAIHLEVAADGTPNWELEGASGGEATEQADSGGSSGDDAADEGGALPISELKLGDIRIENGSLVFVDHAAGTEERVEAIDMKLALADIQSPLEATGSLDYKGETIELDLGLTSPYDVIQGGGSAFGLGVKAAPLQLGFDGQLSNQGAPSASGDIDLSVPSVKGLAAWLAEPLELETEALETLTIAGKLNGSADKVAFTDAVISLDKITGKGEVTADLAGATPAVSGRLDLGMVDVNPYMPPAADDDAAASDEDKAEGEPGGAAAWSDEPIEIALGGVDLAFELTLEGLKAQEVKLGRTVLALNLAGPKLVADLKEFALYEGSGLGRLVVDTSGEQPRVEKQFTLTGLKALPFLNDAAEFERLEGTANAEFNISTTGGTERQFVENLSGDGKVTFTDGAIVGINVASMVRNVGSAFLSADANEARKTDFAELGGSFTIENGVVNSDDFLLQAPGLRVSGAGTVDLPAKAVDYRIEPKAAATLEGQEGDSDVAGLLVPVVVKGPFDDLSYKPDLSGVIDQAIKDPKALKKQVKEQLGAVGDATKDLNSAGDVKDALKKVGKKDGKKLLDSLTKGDSDEDVDDSPAGSLLKGLLK